MLFPSYYFTDNWIFGQSNTTPTLATTICKYACGCDTGIATKQASRTNNVQHFTINSINAVKIMLFDIIPIYLYITWSIQTVGQGITTTGLTYKRCHKGVTMAISFGTRIPTTSKHHLYSRKFPNMTSIKENKHHPQLKVIQYTKQ